MFGNGEIGRVAIGEVDEGVAPSPVYPATAEFEWTLSAEAEFEWDGDESNFMWE